MKARLGEAVRTTLAAGAVAGCAAIGALIFLSSRLESGGDGIGIPLGAQDIATIGVFAIGAGLTALGVRWLAQRRRAPRRRCRLTGVMQTSEGEVFVRAENISRTGARVFIGEARLIEGRSYAMRFGDFETKGEVRWKQGRRIGVAFSDELSARALDRLLETAGSLQAARSRAAAAVLAQKTQDGAPQGGDLSFSAPTLAPTAAPEVERVEAVEPAAEKV